MITVIVVALLALLVFAYVALPLISAAYTDPLPDDSDPVLTGLGEEKDALLRAIAELDTREDLTEERREQLRRRYEAKAAGTLKAIDARAAELAARGRVRGRVTGAVDPDPTSRRAEARPRRVPVAALSLLALGVVAAAFLPSYVLPRVGQDATLTTTDVAAATQIRELQRAADRDPTPANLMALGDAYVSVGELADGRAAYLRATQADGDVPLPVYQRLAVLALQTDLAEAQSWLQLAAGAAPQDAETLFLLSEVAYANQDMEASEAALRSYAALAGSEVSAIVTARLELFDRGDALRAAVEAEPSEENLLALADLYWQAGDVRNAATAYLRVLTETDPQQPVALSRMGVAMLQSGAANDGAALLERAAAAAGGVAALEPAMQLSLGEAYLQVGRFTDAEAVIEGYQAAGGADPVAAELLARARQALAGSAPAASGAPAEAGLGAAVYAANCATCHGPTGAGGVGVALAGNARAADAGNVRDAVTFGRGLMPGFGATLSQEELDAVVDHVTRVVSGG